MNRAIAANAAGQRRTWPLSVARLGDVGLATIWSVLSVGSITRMIADAPEETWLGTAHQAVSAIILCITTILFIVRRPATARMETWQSRAVAIVGTWMMPAVILLPLTWTPSWLLTITTVGLVATHLVVFWAIVTLGRSLSIFAEARQLVRSGPYAIVRHPLYATYTALYVFLVLPRIGVLAVIAAVLGVTCEVWRARNEEQVLRATFPEYDEYAATTPRFIPRLNVPKV